MVCAAVELAKYIVTKCVNDQHPISNLQLQKILYYVQKAYIDKGSQAFPDDIEAWQFGPVVPEAYYRFSGFGAMPISLTYDSVLLSDEDTKIIDPIVEENRAKNPWDLVEETHKNGGAWSLIFKGGLGNHCVIPVSLIKQVG